MPRNVKVSIFVLPFWAIPFNLVNSYASLYMLNQGIPATQVGLINSVGFILKTLLALFAGYIINRFGRRLTVGILDLAGWGIPMLIYFFADSYWQFMLAALINCVTVINGIVSPCFLTEDVGETDRIKAFNFQAIVSSLCGIFVPITGLLIRKFEFIPAIRMLYLFAFISMSAASIGKLVFYRETSVGKALMSKAHVKKAYNPFLTMLKPIRYILANRNLVFLFAMNILLNFALNINNLYFFPFLTQSLKYTDSFISLFPFLTTAISLSIYLFVISRIRHMERSALLSIGLYALGAFMLLLSFFLDRRLALVCVISWAIAGAIMNPVLNTMIANAMKDEMRTEVFGVFNVFSMLCMFPVGILGGWLYAKSPLYPIFIIFGVYLTGLLGLLLFGWKKTGIRK